MADESNGLWRLFYRALAAAAAAAAGSVDPARLENYSINSKPADCPFPYTHYPPTVLTKTGQKSAQIIQSHSIKNQ